jgi:hypothetical protein
MNELNQVSETQYLVLERSSLSNNSDVTQCPRCNSTKTLICVIVDHPEVEPMCFYCATAKAKEIMRGKNE